MTLTFSAYTVLAAEDYYTWVDENGVTNYAEKNPLGYQARFVSKSRTFGQRIATPTPALPNIPDEPSSVNEVNPDAAIAEERAVIAAEIATAKKSNCSIGKKNLARLEMFSRVRVTDQNGQTRILTTEEKSAKENEARQIIKDNCAA
ncbi:MAG: DUF4124 domain-containing protein [Pseudomonadales bacterium]|nr:DUF4124 domain-containing protein [Pseudomonadales bacterium]